MERVKGRRGGLNRDGYRCSSCDDTIATVDPDDHCRCYLACLCVCVFVLLLLTITNPCSAKTWLSSKHHLWP